MKKHYRHQVSNKTLKETPPQFTDRSFDGTGERGVQGRPDRRQPRSRNLGRSRQRQQEVSSDREIVCSRAVIIDSEFDARRVRANAPARRSCFCAIEIDQNGRVIEHRLAAPYPTKPPWDRGDPFLTVGFALSAEAGSMLNIGWTFPLPAIDLYAEYMVIHNTEMSRGDDGKAPGRT